MDTISKNVLEHLSRYPISLRRVIETHVCDGASSANVIARLLHDGLIQRCSNGLDGNYSYYQLTIKGTRVCGVPQNRARPKEAKGLALDLAALWFSCMGEERRKRLTLEELKSLFGAPKGGNVVHVAEESGDGSLVYRLVAPSSTSPLRTVVPSLKKGAFDIVSDDKLIRWVERGTYGIAVLVHSEDRREDFLELIREEELPNIRIHVDVVPTPSNLREFMNAEKEVE